METKEKYCRQPPIVIAYITYQESNSLLLAQSLTNRRSDGHPCARLTQSQTAALLTQSPREDQTATHVHGLLSHARTIIRSTQPGGSSSLPGARNSRLNRAEDRADLCGLGSSRTNYWPCCGAMDDLIPPLRVAHVQVPQL